jgi:hypothetical protein
MYYLLYMSKSMNLTVVKSVFDCVCHALLNKRLTKYKIRKKLFGDSDLQTRIKMDEIK